mmetsp:Transcript_95062/g.211325  ORF Transcript_95062/g.211325 Transcript_95062/m.211325 type:complete len:285 (+) Transcript_95062:830-1684(+)
MTPVVGFRIPPRTGHLHALPTPGEALADAFLQAQDHCSRPSPHRTKAAEEILREVHHLPRHSCEQHRAVGRPRSSLQGAVEPLHDILGEHLVHAGLCHATAHPCGRSPFHCYSPAAPEPPSGACGRRAVDGAGHGPQQTPEPRIRIAHLQRFRIHAANLAEARQAVGPEAHESHGEEAGRLELHAPRNTSGFQELLCVLGLAAANEVVAQPDLVQVHHVFDTVAPCVKDLVIHSAPVHATHGLHHHGALPNKLLRVHLERRHPISIVTNHENLVVLRTRLLLLL